MRKALNQPRYWPAIPGILFACVLSIQIASAEIRELQLQALVEQLGADRFADRNSASERLKEYICDVDKSVCLHLDEFAQSPPKKTQKETINPIRLTERAYAALEAHRDKHQDPEVRRRITEVLATGMFTSAFFDLSVAEQQIIRLPFETSFFSAGAEVSRKNYEKDGYCITDLGNLRIVRKGLTSICGGSSDRVTIRGMGGGGGQSGGGKGYMRYESVNGTTTFEFVNSVDKDKFTFTIKEGVLNVGGRSVKYSKTGKVVFVSPENKVTSVVRLAHTEAKETKKPNKPLRRTDK